MKKLLVFTFISLFSTHAQSQNSDQKFLLDLSAKIFKWEVAGSIDSLKQVFHEKLQVWGTSGDAVNKAEYLQRLSSPNFIHNKVTIEKSTAVIADNTAIIHGDGIFNLTISGNKTVLHLSYMEVFTRSSSSKPWMLLSITAKEKPTKAD